MQIPLGLGLMLKHIKRGTSYEVIALFRSSANFRDNSDAFLTNSSDGNVTIVPDSVPEDAQILLRVTVQMSQNHPSAQILNWCAYRSLDGPRKGDIYVRPCNEFNTQRFL